MLKRYITTASCFQGARKQYVTLNQRYIYLWTNNAKLKVVGMAAIDYISDGSTVVENHSGVSIIDILRIIGRHFVATSLRVNL